jgi:peptidoglycan/LPS O-acetylase OafA/YrhL
VTFDHCDHVEGPFCPGTKPVLDVGVADAYLQSLESAVRWLTINWQGGYVEAIAETVNVGAELGTRATGYRPDWDGLRTIAVYSVLVFHAGLPGFAGGFVGVDIFFVLSGYLITRLLLAEIERTDHIKLIAFYARRMRRLLPASWVTLIVGSILASVYFAPASLDDLGATVRAAFLWVANWHFISTGNDYFNVGETPSAFLHYWSLSLEEQFYLVWPAVILLAGFVARRLRRTPSSLVLWLAVVGGLASVNWAWHLRITDPLHAYYGTDTRAYQLLAGAALAAYFSHPAHRTISVSQRVGHWMQAISLLVIALLVTSVFTVAPLGRGMATVIAVVALLIGLEWSGTGIASRFLSTKPMAMLGRVSYGTYLWHWVIIVLIMGLTPWRPWLVTLVTATSATAIAFISFYVVERPIRTSSWLGIRPALTVVIGVLVSVLLALALPPAANALSPTLREVLRGQHYSATGAGTDWRHAKVDGGVAPNCVGKPIDACRLVDSGTNAPRVVLVGDSHARSTVRMFTTLAQQHHWTLYVLVGSGCPWQWGLLYPRSWGKQTDECVAEQNDWFTRVLPEVRPTSTILLSFSFDAPKRELVMRPANRSHEHLRQKQLADIATLRSVKAIRALGSDALLIEPFPISSTNHPLRCLSDGNPPAKCDFLASQLPVPATARYRHLAATMPRVQTLDLSRVICPKYPLCGSVIDGFITHRDYDHVTSSYINHQAALVYKRMKLDGVLPRPAH